MYLVTNRICLLILFSILNCFNGCQQIIYVNQIDYFNVTAVDQLCQTFQFRSCTYFSEDQKKNQMNWELCLQVICFGMIDKAQKYQTLNECSRLYLQSAKFYAFLLSIIGGVFGLIIVLFFINLIVRSCCKQCRPHQRRQPPIPQPIVLNSQFLSGQSIVRQNCEPQILEVQQYQNIICTICLSKPIAVQLKCGHYSHLLCILEWKKKSGTCPVCREIMTEIHFICKICRKRYNRRSMLEDIWQQEQFNEICPDCSMS